MNDTETAKLWWLEEGERILHRATTSCRYQYVNSAVRQRFPATFFVTDRRFVAMSNRGRTARRRILPMDVPRRHIVRAEAVDALRTASSYYRPWFGRRILRLDIDHKGRELVLGLILPRTEVDAWAATLSPESESES